MTTEERNELETVGKDEIVPSFMKKYKSDGADDITSDILDKLFLQVSHEDKDGIKLGEFYDSVTGNSLGKEVVITVCKVSRTWRKFNSDLKLEKQSNDGITWDDGTPLGTFVKDDKEKHENWACAFIDMFVILNSAPSPIPYILSFKSTSFRTGKKLATAIATFSNCHSEPIYGRNYTLYTEEERKGSKKYALIKYKLNKGFNSEDIVNLASGVRKMVKDVDPVMTEIVDIEPDVQDLGGNDLD